MTKTDCEQIQELMAVYARALDDKEYTKLQACFEPDAVAEFAGFSSEIAGHEAIMGHMRLALDALDVTQHLFTNFIVDVDGDEARLTSDTIAQHVKHGASGGETFLAGGRYDVRLNRRDGAWRFARIAAGTVWTQGNRDILPKT